MKKRLTLLTAILLCFAMLFSFASCTTTDEDEDSTDVFVAATIPVDSNIPVSETDIIDFYNSIMVNLQKSDMFTNENKPGIKLNESYRADNIDIFSINAATGEPLTGDDASESLNALKKSAKAIKDRILKGVPTDSDVIGFGDMDKSISSIVYPYDGTSSLSVEDVVKAECDVDGNNLNIAITLEGNVNTVDKIFGTRDKAEVISDFNEHCKEYANVKDYSVEYVQDSENNIYSTINMSVEVEKQADGTYKCTGRIMSINMSIICDVTADIDCNGSFESYGDIQVKFRFTDTKNYEFDWLGSSTWEPTESTTK